MQSDFQTQTRMNDSYPAPQNIPDDYSCCLVFRSFKKTLMYEHPHVLWQDRTFVRAAGFGLLRRHYCQPNACLERYLTSGWPGGDQGARWDHRTKQVGVFIDDLHLCPKCGTFRLIELLSPSLDSLGIDFQGEFVDLRGGQEVWRLTGECAKRVRTYCETRLAIKEFFFKDCDDQKVCEEVRLLALRSLRKQGAMRATAPPLFPEPSAEINTARIPEKLPWDEGYVYLVRGGGFYKIGLARDANKRLSGLKTSSPFELEMLKSWRCKNPDEIEKHLHIRFDKFRVRGEWFQLSDEVLQSLLNLQDLNEEFPSNGTE